MADTNDPTIEAPEHQVMFTARIITMAPFSPQPVELSMAVIVELACSKCQGHDSLRIAGHHVATFHRLLGDVLERYPGLTTELPPTNVQPSTKDVH